MPIARAAAALSPTVRTTSPARVLRNAQPSAKAMMIPAKNSGLISSALRRLASCDHPPKGSAGRRGAEGWM